MNEITRLPEQNIEVFDPSRFRLVDKAADLKIEEAKRIKDWPALEYAADVKIKEWRSFVAWWSGAVRRPGGAQRGPLFQGRNNDRLSADQAESLTGIGPLQVSRMRTSLKRPDQLRARLLGAAHYAAMLELRDPRGTFGTGYNEWFTPVEYIEMARAVMGGIDLDPATCEVAQRTIGAARHFTVEDDGLRQQWSGRVWLNPPYSRELIPLFVNKMCDEWEAGNLTAVIMLTNSDTDTSWFHRAARVADAVCFTRGRIKFYTPDREIAAPLQGQVFYYFGNDVAAFRSAFRDCGLVF